MTGLTAMADLTDLTGLTGTTKLPVFRLCGHRLPAAALPNVAAPTTSAGRWRG